MEPQTNPVSVDVYGNIVWPECTSHLNNTPSIHSHEHQQNSTQTWESNQTTKDWLENHSLKALGLTVKDLIKAGKLSPNEVERYEARVRAGDRSVLTDLFKHSPTALEYDMETIENFECNLYTAISDYTLKIKQMMHGIRKVFGCVEGRNVGLLIDASNVNLSHGRRRALHTHLLQLLNSQLSEEKIETFYLATYGTRVNTVWPCPMTSNWRVTEDAKRFLQEQLVPSGCSNMLSGIKHMFVFGKRQLDCILLICGSKPDQPSDIIIDYVDQMLSSYKAPRLHVVAYDCGHEPGLNQFLARLARVRETNTYHRYAANDETAVFESDEVAQLIREIKEAQEVIDIVRKIRLKKEALRNSQALSLQQYGGLPPTGAHHLPQPSDLSLLYGPLNLALLHVTSSSTSNGIWQPSSSHDWLSRHGLKARKLGLFQVLAPNAYSQVMGYIASIRRSVTAQIHEQCMTQVRWPDGTVKNVHVDLPQLFEYQKQLRELVSLLEKRVAWLTKGSRGYFGTVIEPHVVIVIDLSQQNSIYLVHIQYCLRRVLEEQIAQKTTFNLISIGSTTQAFRTTRVPVSEENLQSAWEWVKSLRCSGSRNLLAGLRFALENEAEKDVKESPQGIYLFISGVPDQEENVITPYLEQKRCTFPNLRVHVAFYNGEDCDSEQVQEIPSRYANVTKTASVLRSIAQETGGRFHWFRETGIIESDDVRLILDEIDTVVDYSRQCQMLVESVSGKERMKSPDTDGKSSTPKSDSGILTPKEEPAKSTGPLVPRMNLLTTRRQLATIDAQQHGTTRSSSKKLALEQAIATTRGNSDPLNPVGSIRAAPRPIVSGKRPNSTPGKHCAFSGRCAVPKEEEIVTSRDWLRNYSLRSLNLNLNKLVSNTACRHSINYNNPTKTLVEAKYCNGLFPLVNISGSLRHLQYTWAELEVFKHELLKLVRRYYDRLGWLLSGSRRFFGVIVEQCVVILIDLSGSMLPHLEELKSELKRLIWEQLFRNQAVFNLIAFNSDLIEWQQAGPVLADETACHDAIAWIDQLVAEGGTSTEAAICKALNHLKAVDPYTGLLPGQRRPVWMKNKVNDRQNPSTDNNPVCVSKAIYLFTDGKPDNSCASVLKAVSQLWNLNPTVVKKQSDKSRRSKSKSHRRNKLRDTQENEGPPIHTISFPLNGEAMNFLKRLSQMTSGRQHIIPTEANCSRVLCLLNKQYSRLCEEKLDSDFMGPNVSCPELRGDDLKLMLKEISAAHRDVCKLEYFQNVYKEAKSTTKTEE
ncbi:hypothetical protein CRM22_001673 [Opisthorchis felineus]|uniref:VWFA domain-containing protein n=1 Tax=Opisthorchis felineus TaxID=147828 RepID=A0A4S2M9J0_OPIFE|nr:hypothetical protein CRM22_001673 [Opisthorchis felineus]